jgi:hypothetical protein
MDPPAGKGTDAFIGLSGHVIQLRSRLLGRLVRQFQPVLSKRGGVVVSLWGETGLGKSWTAQQLLAHIPCRHSTLHAAAQAEVIAQLVEAWS